MEKKLTYEEYVTIKNLLTKIKSQLDLVESARDEVIKTVNEINDILKIIR
jgi:hypothetical protein